MKRHIYSFPRNKDCEEIILYAVDFYNQKGQYEITLYDVQNFVSGHTYEELKNHANWLIKNHYIEGEENENWRKIKLFKLTESGKEYSDNL